MGSADHGYIYWLSNRVSEILLYYRLSLFEMSCRLNSNAATIIGVPVTDNEATELEAKHYMLASTVALCNRVTEVPRPRAGHTAELY